MNKKIKILFQGDSITAWGRDKADSNNIGDGYVKYAAENIKNKFTGVEFEFVNLGIGGNQTKDLEERLQSDFIDVQPDIVSIMIGINDVWHHAEQKDWIENDVFKARYRAVLEGIKEKTNAKIMMMEPFLMPVADKLYFREDLDPKIQIIRALAREYADVYLPTDGLMASESIGKDILDFASDGVHPSDYGRRYIGKLYCDYVSPLIEAVLSERK